MWMQCLLKRPCGPDFLSRNNEAREASSAEGVESTSRPVIRKSPDPCVANALWLFISYNKKYNILGCVFRFLAHHDKVSLYYGGCNSQNTFRLQVPELNELDLNVLAEVRTTLTVIGYSPSYANFVEDCCHFVHVKKSGNSAGTSTHTHRISFIKT